MENGIFENEKDSGDEGKDDLVLNVHHKGIVNVGGIVKCGLP